MAGKANGRTQTAAQAVAQPGAGAFDRGDFVAPPADDELELAQLTALRAELGDGELDLRIKVHRVDGKARIYCAAYRLDEIDTGEAFLDRIREEWGGGLYRLVMHDGKGFRLNREVRIAERPQRQAQAAADSSTAAAIARLEEKIAALAQPRESETQWLERLKTYRELFAPAAAPAAPPRESPAKMIGELLQVMNGAKELRDAMGDSTGAGDREPSIYQLGAQVLQLIQTTMQPKTAPMLPGAELPPALAAPSSSSPASSNQVAQPQTAPTASDPDQAAAEVALREAITGLNSLAKFNANAESAADMIFDQVPDELLEGLSAPDWWQRLCELAPEVALFEPWYRTVHVELMTLWAKEKQTRAKAGTDQAGAAG